MLLLFTVLWGRRCRCRLVCSSDYVCTIINFLLSRQGVYIHHMARGLIQAVFDDEGGATIPVPILSFEGAAWRDERRSCFINDNEEGEDDDDTRCPRPVPIVRFLNDSSSTDVAISISNANEASSSFNEWLQHDSCRLLHQG